MAVNKGLSKPLDEEDPGFAFSVWTSADVQYDEWLRDALAAPDNKEPSEKAAFKCYFFDDEPEEDEDPAYYFVHALFWPKGARGSNRVWNADCTKVAPTGDLGQYVSVVNEIGEEETAVYAVNETLYSMIKAAWQLNESRYIREDAPGAEEDN